MEERDRRIRELAGDPLVKWIDNAGVHQEFYEIAEPHLLALALNAIEGVHVSLRRF